MSSSLIHQQERIFCISLKGRVTYAKAQGLGQLLRSCPSESSVLVEHQWLRCLCGCLKRQTLDQPCLRSSWKTESNSLDTGVKNFEQIVDTSKGLQTFRACRVWVGQMSGFPTSQWVFCLRVYSRGKQLLTTALIPCGSFIQQQNQRWGQTFAPLSGFQDCAQCRLRRKRRGGGRAAAAAAAAAFFKARCSCAHVSTLCVLMWPLTLPRTLICPRRCLQPSLPSQQTCTLEQTCLSCLTRLLSKASVWADGKRK